eukprot:jgi/Bigna1/81030/fgenesh1_pg.76_\
MTTQRGVGSKLCLIICTSLLILLFEFTSREEGAADGPLIVNGDGSSHKQHILLRKNAVCLYGTLRALNLTGHSIRENVIEELDAVLTSSSSSSQDFQLLRTDVFISTEGDEHISSADILRNASGRHGSTHPRTVEIEVMDPSLNIRWCALTVGSVIGSNSLAPLINGPGHNAFVLYHRFQCREMIAAEELGEKRKGKSYENVAIIRSDLFFRAPIVNPSKLRRMQPSTAPPPPQQIDWVRNRSHSNGALDRMEPTSRRKEEVAKGTCYIACQDEDFDGYCDTDAICDRRGAETYLSQAEILVRNPPGLTLALRDHIEWVKAKVKKRFYGSVVTRTHPNGDPKRMLVNAETLLKVMLDTASVQTLRVPDVAFLTCDLPISIKNVHDGFIYKKTRDSIACVWSSKDGCSMSPSPCVVVLLVSSTCHLMP